MKLKQLFPTLLSIGNLPGYAALNRRLLRDFEAFSQEDKMGKEWSKENYSGGYTSYASLSDMHYRSPSFMDLQKKLQPFAEKFSKVLGWEVRGMELQMTACWMNIMKKGTHHSLHHHPQSVLSGVYYVSTPPKSVPLKIEDPRMMYFMHSPLRKESKDQSGSHYFKVAAKPGQFVMFESWLRHEVPPNQSDRPRICISFNFDLVSKADAF